MKPWTSGKKGGWEKTVKGQLFLENGLKKGSLMERKGKLEGDISVLGKYLT